MKKYIITLSVFCLLIAALTTGCKSSKKDPTNETIQNQTHEEDIPPGEEIEVDEEQEQEIETEIEVESNEEDSHEGQVINPLTGLWINEEVLTRRPIGIMINNLKQAMPQSGIAQADIIYETLVEGGITRLFAIFKDFDAGKIGPVRSARHSYLDFAFDHDAIFVHYGQSEYAKAFVDLNSPHLNGMSYLDSIMFYQDHKRERPHNTYTSLDGLLAGWDKQGYRKTCKEDFVSKLVFSEEAQDLDTDCIAKKVVLDFSHVQKPWFEYDEETKDYARYQFGDKHIDGETGEQLLFKNIIIQLTSIWTIKGDPYGCQNMNLITSGTGYYISHGQAKKITWEKKSHYDPTRYYDEKGNSLILNPGKTWIAVYPKNRESKIIME